MVSYDVLNIEIDGRSSWRAWGENVGVRVIKKSESDEVDVGDHIGGKLQMLKAYIPKNANVWSERPTPVLIT